jgi:hypothetical protein
MPINEFLKSEIDLTFIILENRMKSILDALPCVPLSEKNDLESSPSPEDNHYLNLITIVYFRHDFVPGFFHSALYL